MVYHDYDGRCVMAASGLSDGRTIFNKSFQDYVKSTIWQKVFRASGNSTYNINSTSDEAPAYAHISHSRLVALCPNCGGAEAVWREGPHVMLCANCGNADIQGRLRTVILPDNLNEIEQLLMQRSNPATRNWLSGETIEELEAENIGHGIQA